MEKILVALDQKQPNRQLLDFACFLANLTGSELTAVFLGRGKEEDWQTQAAFAKQPAETTAAVTKAVRQQPADDYLEHFEYACRNKGIRTNIHLEAGDPLFVILAESRFADLLVLDPAMSFEQVAETVPGSFVRAVLSESECPVVLAPYSFNGIEEILLAYDGGASSAFAMKQFSYLFPELADLRVTIMQVSEEEHVPIVEKKKLVSFLQMHYSSIGFRILIGKAEEELQKYLQDKKNIFVVMGAFSRKNLSKIFYRSTAERLLSTVNLPVFIAHNC